jgi:hypothetical protein
MAHVDVHPAVVEVVTPERYSLELTKDEAEYLHRLVGNANGEKNSYDIYDALHKALRS